MYEIVDVRISLRRRFGTDKVEEFNKFVKDKVGITHAGRFYIYVTDYDKFKSNHSLSRKQGRVEQRLFLQIMQYIQERNNNE